MDSKPNWTNRQLADGYNFVDAASAGFDGAVLTIPSSLTGFQQTALDMFRVQTAELQCVSEES